MSKHDSTQIGDVKVMLKIGTDGAGIKTIEKTGADGIVDIYTITLDDGAKHTFNVTNGRAVQSIRKTGTRGLEDTYTITYNNGTTSAFIVTNGTNGSNANLASVAPTLTAEKDYNKYEHLIYNDIYYICTKDIIKGDVLTVGENIEEIKVGDELSTILNIHVENGMLVLPRTGASVEGGVLTVGIWN
nr:MAG TPA: hypothetical protein [Caudoviricetes sp.]